MGLNVERNYRKGFVSPIRGKTDVQRLILPRGMYHGKDALETSKTLGGKKAIICIGGGSMHRGGLLDRTVAYLKEAGMRVRLFEDIESDPSVETAVCGADEVLTFEPGWIVAVGGGSPIDVARVMWAKYEYPEVTFGDVCKVFGIPKLRGKAQFCAISSTFGTTAEVAVFFIIIGYQKGIKYPTADFEITPNIAIVDPDLAMTTPIRLVAHTDMNAMAHAVEAYVSTASSNFTDPLATHAVEMIEEHPIKSYNGDMDSHAVMYDIQYPAGQAFSNAFLGIVYSMVHKTGAVFVDQGAYIIHGTANAMYLPKVTKLNAKDETARKRYGVIADYMHLGSPSDKEKVDLLVVYLHEMSDTLHIPYCIARYGKDGLPAEEGFVSRDVSLARVEDITANAILDTCTGSNPRQPSQEGVVKLLECCYYNTEMDFQYRN